MNRSNRPISARLMCGAAAVAILACSSAHAADAKFEIAPQPLDSALREFGVQSGVAIMADADITFAKRSPGFSATADPETALGQLLAGTGLSFKRDGDVFVIAQQGEGGGSPQSGSAAGDGADGTVEALIVTAQKREEDIQDVPIAISAFTQEDLTRSQVAGGPDLITQVPNMTFTKTNFSSYSVQLRGIGTQAISATTDPAVAVAFNNTPFIRNRFFEQEFYDLQRVEVLRGPQGTLYGRNATAGVVNIISQKPKFVSEAKLSGDISNYNSSRIEGMINIPLVEDKVALRLAGAWTKRDGYATNQISGNPIDGRDLWSTRVSLRFSPTDRIDANLIWEHFEENDDRLRSGKQLCKKHIVTELAGMPVPGSGLTIPAGGGQGGIMDGPQAAFNQGCVRVSLYSPEAFQTPQGYMLPFYMPLGAVGLPIARPAPYISEVQSQDLRVIESTVDPDYRAKADIGEFQISIDLTDTLTLTSETAYAADEVFSIQDYNRFNTAPGAWLQPRVAGPNVAFPDRENALIEGPNGGIFCDPQLGCSDRLIVVDLSTADARQFTQEFRISSDYGGAFNFSLGANFMRADSMDKYYVFSNSFSLFTIDGNFSRNAELPPYIIGETDNLFCQMDGAKHGNPNGNQLFNGLYPVEGCHYTDPNPIGSLNDEGHNYFLSKNPYKLISYAAFGEAYYTLSDALKITAGLRFTVDKKEAPRIPSWLLAAESFGYPVGQLVEQEWREPTGRLAIDWKPDLAFTDETLLYASYAHGYKAGGANPPPYVRAVRGQLDIARAQLEESALRPRTFEAEFVDAFEIGMKNTLLDNTATANLAAFYYDYKDYQISEIVDRSAFNRNLDATVWGVELEVDWRPLDNLRLGFKGGYQKTSIADGERAIDLMDRTAGDPRWVLARPFPTYASSCILPAWLLVGNVGGDPNPELVNARGGSGGFPTMCEYAYDAGLDPITGETYVANPATHSGVHNGPINYAAWSTDPNDYPGAVWPGGVVGTAYPGWDPTVAYGNNNGDGIFKDLSGNELPNAPQWTATITADYTLPLPNDWLATLHTDLHWQAESWWRVFNDHEFSRLDEYFTMNLAAIFTNEEAGWNVMAYIKNVTDETAITGAFLNSDDTGLTTNVFLTEPRLYGLRVTKAWGNVPWLDGFDAAGGPFPVTIELSGQVLRHVSSYEEVVPGFAPHFQGGLDIFGEAQNQDLDLGDGRSIKATWRPGGGDWSVAAGVRYGRANGDLHRRRAEFESDPACGFGYEFLCTKYLPPDHYQRPLFDIIQNFTHTNFADAAAKDREEHQFVDFAVGKDVSIGGLHRSSFAAGLRFASLDSSTHVELAGVPNWQIPEGWIKYQEMTHDHFSTEVDAHREFEGTGPMLSWDASLALLGGEDSGRALIDWSVNGGVLFGRQKTSVAGVENESGYSVTGLQYAPYWQPPITTEPPVVVAFDREESVTTPFLEISAGLAYEINRVRIGAGYRWERYFDVLDVGYAAAKDGDRTIDGPYFKLSVGFGG